MARRPEVGADDGKPWRFRLGAGGVRRAGRQGDVDNGPATGFRGGLPFTPGPTQPHEGGTGRRYDRLIRYTFRSNRGSCRRLPLDGNKLPVGFWFKPLRLFRISSSRPGGNSSAKNSPRNGGPPSYTTARRQKTGASCLVENLARQALTMERWGLRRLRPSRNKPPRSQRLGTRLLYPGIFMAALVNGCTWNFKLLTGAAKLWLASARAPTATPARGFGGRDGGNVKKSMRDPTMLRTFAALICYGRACVCGGAGPRPNGRPRSGPVRFVYAPAAGGQAVRWNLTHLGPTTTHWGGLRQEKKKEKKKKKRFSSSSTAIKTDGFWFPQFFRFQRSVGQEGERHRQRPSATSTAGLAHDDKKIPDGTKRKQLLVRCRGSLDVHDQVAKKPPDYTAEGSEGHQQLEALRHGA